ncbi:hypothetical protein Zm00014a_038860 [Zea mays]|uniref:Uncharacterized protein n=1 Tax=Zea mays TaxID=4577 RepID=A0A3L6EZQ9_MAIZE|nr:hypothetical protein Zm00014a_038860 [Zea mays]
MCLVGRTSRDRRGGHIYFIMLE